MLLRAILIAAFVFNAVPAAACHHFTVWRYHWPQRCGATHNSQRSIRHKLFPPRSSAVRKLQPPAASSALVLPELTPVVGEPADGETAGRLLLHAILGR